MKMLWGLRLSLATLGLFAWAWSAQAETVSVDWASPAGEGDLDGIHVDTHFAGGAIVTLTDNFSGSNYVPALGTVSTLHFDFGGTLDILFSEAVSDLYLYARDFVPPSNATSARFFFHRPFTIVSGFVGATTTSDSITTTNGSGNGVLLFQGPFEALRIDSEANCIFSFVIIPLTYVTRFPTFSL